MSPMREDETKIKKVLDRLKKETGHDWFPISGFFTLEPYVEPYQMSYSSVLGSMNSTFNQQVPGTYSVANNSWGTQRVLVKLFVDTKTSEVRTILAQSLLQTS